MKTEYHEVASAEAVTEAIDRLATQILEDYPSTSLFVALLRGAAPFTSKLMFELVRQSPDYHPELDYMMVSTYGTGREAREPHIVTDLAPTTAVKGRDVVIIDDVLDKGVTADFVTKHLQARGAGQIRLAVLCEKKTDRIIDIQADYCGFSFVDEWLVGMGLDDASTVVEGYRWLDCIKQVRAD